MNEQAQPPLVPVEVDLRDFAFMPLDIIRLFGSRFHAIATDAEWRAGVTLWAKSFHQVPAASIPDDDVELCRLAELGRDIKTWRKVREVALHGWIKCSDGRLYHPIVAEKANEAWSRKQAQRARSIKGNSARWGLQKDRISEEEVMQDGQPEGSLKDSLKESSKDPKGQGQGQGQGLEDKPPAPREGRAGDNHPGTAEPSPYAAVCIALRAAGMQAVNPSHPVLRALVDAGAEPAEFVAAAARADGKDDPFAYVLAVVKGDRKRAAETAGVIHRGPLRVIGKQTAIEEANRRAGEEWLAQQEPTDASR